MSIKITVGEKELEIKFNYGLVFKLNKALESETSAANGAGFTYTRLKSGDESALVDIIKLASGNASEDEVLEAIEQKGAILNPEDVASGVDSFTTQLIEEIEGSGFFLRMLRTYKKRVQEQIEMFPKKSTEYRSLESVLEILSNVN
jgi:nitrogen fixation/metabolism regulation signal transduction histidine kinase